MKIKLSCHILFPIIFTGETALKRFAQDFNRLAFGSKEVCYERQRISLLLVRQRGWRRNEYSVIMRDVMQPPAAAVAIKANYLDKIITPTYNLKLQVVGNGAVCYEVRISFRAVRQKG